MCTFLLDLLTKFRKNEYLFREENGISSRKSISVILNIDLGKLQYQKPIRSVILVRKQSPFSNDIVISEIEDSFRMQCVKIFIVILLYLISELPFDVKFI